ncbi:hypothetical protein Q6Z19_003208 [Salmonella enterica]|nr:hypothetical protein [Salmonella enterica]EJJ4102967.1 hypothetical protein [Salmonella enterica]ELG7064667.1 hypothetical protein [Salmonella enterica]ELG7111567.1 hypothetical protein [Salmonella enterica]ELG7154869.1 hypothetical protein [Salmonella enterica]
MTTITNNKLTDEEITALALKLFDGSSFYFQSGRRPGAKTMAELLNKAASAVAELQERRRTDNQEPASERERIRRKTEPVAYLVCNGHLYQDRPFLDLSTARKSVKDRNDGAEIKALCVCEISAEK